MGLFSVCGYRFDSGKLEDVYGRGSTLHHQLLTHPLFILFLGHRAHIHFMSP